MFPKSIRWRLQLWYGVLLVVVLGGFGFTAYQLERGRQFRRIDDELQRRVGALANALHEPRNRPARDLFHDGAPFDNESPRDHRFPGELDERFRGKPSDFHLPPQQAALFDETDTNGFYYLIINRDGNEIARSKNAPPSLISEKIFSQTKPGQNSIDDLSTPPPRPPEMRDQFREITIKTPPGEVVLAGRSVARELSDLHLTAIKLTGVAAIIIVLALTVGWWLASRAIRPIGEISSAAAKISSGNLSQRINVAETESELGQLAHVLNSTFARLDAAFNQQARFTADAAHELRTPISVMLTQTQGALTRDRSAVEYRETIEACNRASQRMRRLIESLLELARLDAGQEPMKKITFDLSNIARDSVELLLPIALEKKVKMDCAFERTITIGDSERISQVVTNLLSNAIHYNQQGGQIRVRTSVENDCALLEVKDSGIGMSESDLPHIFDRFFRVEASRSSGRSGLGLSISKAIIEAHGGQIEVSSKLGEGTIFTVRLPSAKLMAKMDR